MEIVLESSKSFLFLRSKSEEIDDEDVQYYHTKRCAEAGEEYNPELKWLDSELESEVNNDQSSGCGSGVLEGSSGEYFAPSGDLLVLPVPRDFVNICRDATPPELSGCSFYDCKNSKFF